MWYKLLVERFSSIGTRKGKCPVLRTNTKPQQLTKHTKISYSIASLAFRKVSCGTYRNGLNQGATKLRHYKYSKSTNRVSLIPFAWNLHFIILACSCIGCGTSNIYLCLEDNRSSFSWVSLKSKTKHVRS